MNDNFRTIIVPANNVEALRDIAKTIFPGGDGMFISELSETGESPATHYISTGFIPSLFTDLLPLQKITVDEEGTVNIETISSGDSTKIVELCTTPDDEGNIPLEITKTKVTRVLNSLHISEEKPVQMKNRLSLQNVREELSLEN